MERMAQVLIHHLQPVALNFEIARHFVLYVTS